MNKKLRATEAFSFHFNLQTLNSKIMFDLLLDMICCSKIKIHFSEM